MKSNHSNTFLATKPDPTIYNERMFVKDWRNSVSSLLARKWKHVSNKMNSWGPGRAVHIFHFCSYFSRSFFAQFYVSLGSADWNWNFSPEPLLKQKKIKDKTTIYPYFILAAKYNTIRYDTIRYDTIQYNTIYCLLPSAFFRTN